MVWVILDKGLEFSIFLWVYRLCTSQKFILGVSFVFFESIESRYVARGCVNSLIDEVCIEAPDSIFVFAGFSFFFYLSSDQIQRLINDSQNGVFDNNPFNMSFL